MRLNKPLALAYYMKEDLRQFWEQPGKKYATLFLNDWIRRAKASGVHMLLQMAKTLDPHRPASWPTTTIPSAQVPLKGPTTRSRP